MLSAEDNSAHNSCTDSMAECIMPGIYLSKSFLPWQEEQLRTYSFTHIIIIDKHIQELYYPDQNGSIFKTNSIHTTDIKTNPQQTLSASIGDVAKSSEQRLKFNKEFDIIDLNFGDKTYLKTVLPNCYRAVKFINKALQADGTILVIDCKGGEQKCVTIVVAYLMYKYNINFNKAFARLKESYKNANLDRYYISQLYEYEPILKVQRAHSHGHSCSRVLHAAVLKRKRPLDDESHPSDIIINDNQNGIDADADDDGDGSDNSTNNSSGSNDSNVGNDAIVTTASLLNNFNPLNKFNAMDVEEQLTAANTTDVNAANATAINGCSSAATNKINGSTLLPIASINAEEARTESAATITSVSPGKSSNSWNYCDDYVME